VTDTSDWRQSRLKRVEVAAIAAVGYPLIALLGRTLRWRVEGLEHLDEVIANGRQPIYGFWHGRILSATYFFRRRGIVVMTSENFDGEWIARIISRFGYGTARGSTSRGARKALLQLRRSLDAGRPVAFTLDGPRGPAHSAQPGAVWLAGATGQPIVPFHLEAARYWSVRSWDRTQVPKPFSLVALAVGAPIEVPAGASEAILDRKRAELETTLAALAKRAAAMARGKPAL
jgi:lysophospholipid acyltransferase (LPLAT)-like uncharacterized protein